jgi:hypothetical protein
MDSQVDESEGETGRIAMLSTGTSFLVRLTEFNDSSEQPFSTVYPLGDRVRGGSIPNPDHMRKNGATSRAVDSKDRLPSK